MPAISVLTDFGLRDPFVGELKAELLRGGCETVIDLTHEIDPGNVREASWVLLKSWARFPSGTCHLAVVDPGVGSARRAIVAAAGGHRFVGPDNGILAAALADAGGAVIHEIAAPVPASARRGTTFDGRDLFAPAAARLARGAALAEFGPKIGEIVRLAPFDPVPDGGGWSAEVIRVDRFGNVVTVVEESFLRSAFGEGWTGITVTAGGRAVRGIRRAYDEVGAGEPLLTIGGSGTLELCVNRGRASDGLALRAGDSVRIVR
ncbi:MAG: SAM hydrolase/SAM-dependent halogenase family protein [Candidatus Eiseniibacteriota bacterium]